MHSPIHERTLKHFKTHAPDFLPGGAVAARFAKAYPVVLLARTSATYESSVKAINDAGGKAIGINADAADRASLDAAFATIAKELPDHKLAAAIYNASAGLQPKPFVEVDPQVLETSIDVNMCVLLLFPFLCIDPFYHLAHLHNDKRYCQSQLSLHNTPSQIPNFT